MIKLNEVKSFYLIVNKPIINQTANPSSSYALDKLQSKNML